jgi:hypothetical protein
MILRNLCLLGVFALSLLLVTGALAHVPVTAGDNEALETATYISDPLKSWVVYSKIHEGGVANYYRFDMERGQRLRILLFTPEKNLFMPGLVIMGQGIEPQGTVPASVDVPEGFSAMVFEGKQPDQASYEPFTPASQYERVDIDMTVNTPGTYYVAVYESSHGGQYGIALGYREEFKVDEWIRVPLDIIRIHLWEGQSPGFIFAPMLSILVIGTFFLFWQRKKGVLVLQSPFGWIGSFVGFLYLGSGAIILIQMAIALRRTAPTSSVIITSVFALLPLLAGLATLRVAMQARGKIERKTRVKMAIMGIVGLFVWAGLVIGPVLAIVASLLPSVTKPIDIPKLMLSILILQIGCLLLFG